VAAGCDLTFSGTGDGSSEISNFRWQLLYSLIKDQCECSELLHDKEQGCLLGLIRYKTHKCTVWGAHRILKVNLYEPGVQYAGHACNSSNPPTKSYFI